MKVLLLRFFGANRKRSIWVQKQGQVLFSAQSMGRWVLPLEHVLSWRWWVGLLLQGFPTFLAPGTNFMEDSVSRNMGEGSGDTVSGWFKCITFIVHFASNVTQLVKNLPALWKTGVWSLGWEDPLEKGRATHPCILGLPLWLRLVKNLPAMWETWVWSQGWEDTLEKGKTTHSRILA